MKDKHWIPKIGDLVTFETSKVNPKLPRYNFFTDEGGSGDFIVSAITEIVPDKMFIVKLPQNKQNIEEWAWPLPTDSPHMYTHEGYIRPWGIAYQHTTTKICSCDITQLWNFGHTVGCVEKT